MSVRTVSITAPTSNAGLNVRQLQSAIQREQVWVRNPSWPAISAVAGNNKMVGLYAVWPGDGVGNGGNFFAAICSGAYTINYGDGTTTNYAAGTQANYEINYNSASLAGTNAPVTLTDAGDLVTRTAHGYTNGMTVQFYNIVTTTGLSAAAQYFVINATANTFQVSTTFGGAAVALTNNGSATLLPYKIAVVTITPQAGQTLTSINLAVINSTIGLTTYATGWLDIAIACSTLTTLLISSSSNPVHHSYVEQVRIVESGAITTFLYSFSSCTALRSVSLSNTAAVTNTSGMFSSCYSLTSVPLFDTSAVTIMDDMFSNCFSLTSVPLFNTAAVTTMQYMFSGCISLTTVPLFNTAAVTSMSGMFVSCYSLTSVPAFVLNVGMFNVASMFSGCSSLARIQVAQFRLNFSVQSCKLSATALNEIYTNLPTIARTITVFDNYGTATDNPAIATAKGWTVSG